MSITTRKNDEDLIIQIDGSTDLKEFRTAYEEFGKLPRYIIDFAKVDSIDNSVLGMLLILREHAKKADIQLINCSSDAAKLFQTARLDKKFTIILSGCTKSFG